MQLYAVGIDSVAIVVSPDMTWFPTDLNTLQVTQLFASTTPFANVADNGTSANTPLYSTWSDFFTANGISTAGVPAAALSEPINSAVRDPTSGTFDCFNNYFAVPNGYQFEHKTSGTMQMHQKTWHHTHIDTENINILIKSATETSHPRQTQ